MKVVKRRSFTSAAKVLLALSLVLAAAGSHARIEAADQAVEEATADVTEELEAVDTVETEAAETAGEEDSSQESEEEIAGAKFAAEAEEDTGEVVIDEEDWVTFFLLCNEGMNNDKGNVGNTMMALSMNPGTGQIRMMMITWDTFVEYEGYDVPQLIDMAYRNNGPEETMKVFDANFGMNIDRYMSLNYLNLASLIDAYGGVDVDISRAERNALNGMVGSKKRDLQKMADQNLLSQMALELLTSEYYLNEFGPGTHLNGLQAVGYGWLQYDSVYNCCLRDIKVIGNLFYSCGKTIGEEIAFYTDGYDAPAEDDARRAINLDHLTDEDLEFIRDAMDPIFSMAYHNLEEEEIMDIATALARVSYEAARQGVDILDLMTYRIFPLECHEPYDLVAGTEGHLIDYEENSAQMRTFLFGE